MTDISEPPVKKAKMVTTTIENLLDDIMKSNKNLQAVLNDDVHQTIPLIKFYVGQVKDPKDISKVFQVLHEKVPIKGFNHLKKAKKSSILLCPIHFLNSTTQESIQEFLDNNASEVKDCFEYFREVDVPLNPPLTRKQYLECNKHWSVNFHPNKYLEKLLSDDFFKAEELCLHRCYMGIALEVAKYYKADFDIQDVTSDINAAVVVDPRNWSVVAVAFDKRKEHPIQHAGMLAVDNVARTQNGGAWSTLAEGEAGALAGIDKDLLMHLKDKFPNVSYGAKTFVSKSDDLVLSADSPYLCTGYYIYLLREPCVMCSMGLVHARVKRVFFCFDNSLNGALKSKTKLQCVESLNHHFEVFTGFI